jgi:hypothetical protein
MFRIGLLGGSELESDHGMAGSLEKRGRDSWRLVVSAGYDPVSGQRRRIQRTVHGSKREAERALARLLVEVEGGRESEYARLRLGTYLTERYLEKAKTRLRPETWDRYECCSAST